MLFLDRLFLAHYSLDALNASANASLLVQLLQFWCISTVSIVEVLIGQYNGAGQKDRLGEPIWQMIWLSVGTLFIFLPIGLFAGPYIFSHAVYAPLETEYFKWLMVAGPFAVLSGALSAFYIGRGKVKFVTIVMVLANVVNILLDIVLIFGVGTAIPAYGIAGAAIATAISQVFQAVVFFIAFYRPHNRVIHGTGHWRFNKKIFMQCVELGVPNAIAHTLEILAWVFMFHLMTQLGPDYITVVAVSQSIFFLFTFMTEGVSKGATAIASNFIGSKQSDLVWKLLKSGVKFYLWVFLFLGAILAIHPDPLIHLFLPPETVTLTPEVSAALRTTCIWVWIFFLFDGISWLLVGLLTAAGDTKFIMKVGGLGPWLIALLPVYVFVFQLGAEAHVTWMLIAFYGVVSCLIYLLRFRSERWKPLVTSEVQI